MNIGLAVKKVGFGLVAAMGMMGAGIAEAAPITYHIDQAIGGGNVMGTIETDGTTGVLATGNFVAWSLTLNGIGASYTITNADSVVLVTGSDVTATATQLLFNFSGGDSGYLLFQQGLFSGNHYYCDSAQLGACFQGATVTPQSIFDSSAQHVPMSGNQVIATAGDAAVPEPATLTVLGLSLIGLGVIGRRKRFPTG
jgi:hypothetical protein